jgi:UDP-hydrolysing UDP-N-acetyl-D-glucosamine 2-epimerase
MIKSLFIYGQSLVDIFSSTSYDMVLLAGDRGEQLVAAMTAFHLDVPIIHIQAGERSGHIDGMTRHAISRFAHIHICANNDAADRLKRFGEESFRIKTYGAPQLDEIFAHNSLSDQELFEHVGPLNREFALLVYHPTSEESLDESRSIIKRSISLLIERNIFVIGIAPNSDAGSSRLKAVLDDADSAQLRYFTNLRREIYLELLKRASMIVGNSSSGILEAPVFGTPCLNIGMRQRDRYQGDNVSNISVNADDAEIDSAIQTCLSLGKIPGSIYGDGSATKQIIQLVRGLESSKMLLTKRISS